MKASASHPWERVFLVMALRKSQIRQQMALKGQNIQLATIFVWVELQRVGLQLELHAFGPG